MYKIVLYQTQQGRIPYREWIGSLDSQASSKIKARLERLELGNIGDFKNIGLGIFELRVHWGPGYRIYFGFEGRTIVILLLGGDKSTQESDIRKAQIFWQDYIGRKK